MNWLNTESFRKFCAAFFPAFVSTGILLGMLYVIVMRAIRVNRQHVEDWLEKQRVRLQTGSVPIIERAHPVMLAALHAIYGRTILRRIATSFAVGTFFTLAIFSLVFLEYRTARVAVRQQKADLEMEADTKLYAYVTDPALNPRYKESRMTKYIPGWESGETEWVYKGGIYDELRQRYDEYPGRILQKLTANPEKLRLTIVFLVEGTVTAPGFHWIDSALLFLFNVILDFVSISTAIFWLQRLGKDTRLQNATLTFAYMAGCTLACFATALLSYRCFFRGNLGFFKQILVTLPLSLTAIIFSLAVLFIIRKSKDREGNIVILCGGVVLALAGFWGLKHVWSFWHASSLGLISWRDIFVFPYVLAATTLIPALLTLAAFDLMLIAKLTAESGRVLPEVYMTVIKEEAGSTHAFGVIGLVSLTAGTVIGMVWATK